MEHKFITPKDNFVSAIILCRTRLTDCNANEIIQDLLNSKASDVQSANYTKPEISMELYKWIEYNQISSANLRKAIVVEN